jgi:hypothetical protein
MSKITNAAECSDCAPIFDFDKWRAEREQKRAERRAELARLISCGCTILETFSSGVMIDWTIDNYHDPASARIETYHHDSGHKHYAFVAEQRYNTPAFLADHLENRSNGFGFALAVYCLTCGETPIALDTVMAGGADPTCTPCAEKLQAAADESGIDID